MIFFWSMTEPPDSDKQQLQSGKEALPAGCIWRPVIESLLVGQRINSGFAGWGRQERKHPQTAIAFFFEFRSQTALPKNGRLGSGKGSLLSNRAGPCKAVSLATRCIIDCDGVTQGRRFRQRDRIRE